MAESHNRQERSRLFMPFLKPRIPAPKTTKGDSHAETSKSCLLIRYLSAFPGGSQVDFPIKDMF
jgi:hypothetical protein